jgi:hypothetical protein
LSGLPWFRMYAEFATDPDVQTLAFEDQRHYLVILCLKCNGTLDKDYPTAERRLQVIRRTLGLGADASDECKRRLMEAGLIDLQWQPLGWDNRQYASDSSAERTREWRERQHRLGDVTVTDQIQIQKQSKPNKKTRPQKRCPEDFVLTDALKVWASQKAPSVNIEAETERFRDYEFHTAHCDWEATWREWMRKSLEKKGGSSGTSRQVSKPRLSSVERVYAATAAAFDDGDGEAGGGSVAVNG